MEVPPSSGSRNPPAAVLLAVRAQGAVYPGGTAKVWRQESDALASAGPGTVYCTTFRTASSGLATITLPPNDKDGET